jgi:hypothetical protein
MSTKSGEESSISIAGLFDEPGGCCAGMRCHVPPLTPEYRSPTESRPNLSSTSFALVPKEAPNKGALLPALKVTQLLASDARSTTTAAQGRSRLNLSCSSTPSRRRKVLVRSTSFPLEDQTARFLSG